jgi:hypothetical protein
MLDGPAGALHLSAARALQGARPHHQRAAALGGPVQQQSEYWFIDLHNPDASVDHNTFDAKQAYGYISYSSFSDAGPDASVRSVAAG